MQNAENLSEEQLKKQTFLKTEIIDAGYFVEDFAEFLENQKPEGKKNREKELSLS